MNFPANMNMQHRRDEETYPLRGLSVDYREVAALLSEVLPDESGRRHAETVAEAEGEVRYVHTDRVRREIDS